MKLSELCSFLDEAIPLSFQEDYDNSGLQLGESNTEISSALLCVDITEAVVDEAVTNGCQVIISHHPLIFGPLKRISDRNSTGKIILKAIKSQVALYSAHTNLDSVNGGISHKLAHKLGLSNIQVLLPQENKLLKLVIWIPVSAFEEVRKVIFDAGAGTIGAYDMCSFSSPGEGTFRGNETTKPFAGKPGHFHKEQEIRLETIVPSHQSYRVVRALLEAHPYEEPAYDLVPLANSNSNAGIGITGKLAVSYNEYEFLEYVKQKLDLQFLRHSPCEGRKIQTVALCGGAGASLIRKAAGAGADAYITADLKYHNFFEGINNILLVDAGHYETEKYASEILHDLIIKKFPKFALRFSGINTNPINYL